jgi:hypothetical protein
VLVLVNPAHALYGTTPSQGLKNSLASQQQMIVGEGKTATFRVNPAVAGLDMYWEFKRSLKFWGDAVSTGTSELVVRGKDAVYLETLLGGTSEAALSKLEGMRLSTAAGSPAVVSSGGSIQSGSFSSGTYTLKLSAGATVVGSGTSMSFQAVASGSQIVKAGTAYAGVSERYSVVDPEVISIRAASLLDEGTYTAVVKVPVGILTNGTFATAEHRSEPWVLTVNALPLITEHPFVESRFPGQPATLSVGGFFSPETRFTWYARYAGETAWLPLPSGADPRTHVISNVQIADEGDYRVEATNGAGTVVSNSTYMTVERPAFLTLSAEGLSAGTVGVFPGSALSLDVLVTGSLSELPSGLPSGVTFQKLQPGNKWGNIGAPAVLAGTAGYGVASVSEEHEGYYRVSATGKVNGVVYSNVVKVEVYDPIAFTTTKVASVVATAGESFTLTAPVTGYAPQYQWFLNGSTISGATLASFSATAGLFTAGMYSVEVKNSKPDGSPFSAPVTLVVAQVSVNDRPVVEVAENDLVRTFDEGSTLIVTASLSGTPGEVRYQWRKDGKPLLGAGVSGVAYVTSGGTSQVRYTKTGVRPSDEGHYDLVATNAFGVATGPLVRVEVFAVPTLLGSPSVEDVVASSEGEAVFRVNAVGSGTLTYQWYRLPDSGVMDDSLAITAVQDVIGLGTLSSLRLTAALAMNRSKYYVKVSNVSTQRPYSTYSNAAMLKVASKEDLLSIGSIKLNNVTTNGAAQLSLLSANTLRAEAIAIDPGSLKLSYQWRRNGEKIASGLVAASGTVNLTSGTSTFALEYRLPAQLDASSEGVYDLIVDNGVMVVASPSVSLTMDPKIVSVEIPTKVNPSDPLKMSATFVGSASSYKYEWYKGATRVKDATVSGASPFTVEYGISAAANTGTLAAGSYKVRVFAATGGGSVESKPVLVSVANAASITTPPAANVRFNVTSGFTISAKAEGAGLKYQWSRNGASIVDDAILTGGTSDTLTLSGTWSAGLDEAARQQAAQNLVGVYQLKVWNEFSMALSSVVNVSMDKELQVEVIQPGTVDIGGSANLIANASGPGQLSYQWYKDELLIQGATGETLKISPVTKADGGTYHVTVSSSEDPGKKEPSNKVVLGVRDVPRILVAPVSRIVGGAGTTTSKVSFTVVAESRAGGTLGFEWANVGTGTVTSKGNTSTVTVTVPTEATRSESTYSVTVSSVDSADGKVQSGSITLTAKLTVLPSGQVRDKSTTAGSDGVSVHTGWWVYWVKATKSDGSSRNGYYALERESSGGVVTPRRALWVWQLQDAAAPADTYPKDDWLEGDQSVVDAVASERGEFSVLASRVASGSIASGDYAIAGRVEEEGEGALYGAPDFVEGVYSFGAVGSMVEEAVELSWDMEQVYRLDLLGSDLPSVTTELQKVLRDVLLNSD